MSETQAELDAAAEAAFRRWYDAPDSEQQQAYAEYERLADKARVLLNSRPRPPRNQADPSSSTWPEGVIARYRTDGLATVDVREAVAPDYSSPAACTGCGEDEDFTGLTTYEALRRAKEWAQKHAEKCRAMSRPSN